MVQTGSNRLQTGLFLLILYLIYNLLNLNLILINYKPPIASKRKREVWGVYKKTPVLCFDTGWVEMPPSRILTRGGHWGVVETPPSRQNARGRCGMGRNAPRLAFRREGGIGEWSRHPHRIEMREGGVGWVEMPPSRVSTRGGHWGMVETPPSC